MNCLWTNLIYQSVEPEFRFFECGWINEYMLRRPVRKIQRRQIFGIGWTCSWSKMQRSRFWQTAVGIQVNMSNNAFLHRSFADAIISAENIWQRRSTSNSHKPYFYRTIRIALPMPLASKRKQNLRSMKWTAWIQNSTIKMSTPKKLRRKHGYFEFIQFCNKYLGLVGLGMHSSLMKSITNSIKLICFLFFRCQNSAICIVNAVEENELINESTSAL